MHSNKNIVADIFCMNYSPGIPSICPLCLTGLRRWLSHSKHFCSLMSCISPFPTMSQVCNTSGTVRQAAHNIGSMTTPQPWIIQYRCGWMQINLHLVQSSASAMLTCVYLKLSYFFTKCYIYNESKVFFNIKKWQVRFWLNSACQLMPSCAMLPLNVSVVEIKRL